MKAFQSTLIKSLSCLAMATLAFASAHAQTLNGAGATFPQPLYQKWFDEYHAKTGIQVNYQGVGSGAGIKAITSHTVDFGASDAPMSDAEVAAAPGIIHIPTVAGAIVVAYHIPGVGPGIHLTGPVIADIYLGKIKSWSDPRIAALSPGTHFPNVPIVAMHRSDGSGTTNGFTTYLSEVSPEWKSQIGANKSVNWPNGLGGKGNPGVAALVQSTSGGIGYIELAYAVKNSIAYAAVRNAKGKYIYPSVAATTAAAAGSVLPADFRKVITNTSAPVGYPITSFTFLLVYPNSKPQLKSFLTWALTDGQNEASSMLYAPLPASVRKRALAKVEGIH